MSYKDVLNKLVEEGLLTPSGEVKPHRPIYVFEPGKIRELFTKLIDLAGVEGFYVSTIVGTDLMKDGKVRLDYYVVFLPEEETIVIRTFLPRENPEIDSLLDIIPGVLSGECETYDLLGVVFKGNPALKRGFFVPKDVYEKGIYPLRKDAKV